MKYKSSQKLWRIIEEPVGHFYEIKLAGVIIDRIKISDEKYNELKEREMV